jgi:molecular chaperone GrpE (heat shock protein)
MAARGKKEKTNLTVVPEATESTPKEGAKMTTEELKAQIKELKEKEKVIREEAKKMRADAKAAKAAAKAAGITQVYSRLNATADFIKSIASPLTLEEIVDGSNKLYSDKKASAKSDNPREAKAVATYAVHLLTSVGYLVVADGKYSKA